MVRYPSIPLAGFVLFTLLCDSAGQNYDYIKSATAVDTAVSLQSGDSNDVVSVTLDLGSTASKVTNVLVLSAMNMRPYGTNNNDREMVYEIKNSRNADVSGEIKREVNKQDDYDFGAATLVHIFDVSALSGNVTYTLEQWNNSSGPSKDVETIGHLTAIALNTELNDYEVNSSGKRIESDVSTTSSIFSTVTGLVTDTLVMPLKGDVFVAASINCHGTGASDLVGEWILQYQIAGGGSWTDLGFPVQTTIQNNSDDLIVSLVALARNIDPESYFFRVAHRKVGGSGTVNTFQSNLVSVSLTHEGRGYFPAFYSESEPQDTLIGQGSMESLTTATVTSPADISGIGPSLLVHTQYVALAHDLETNERLLAKYQVYIDNGTTEEAKTGFRRLLADNSDFGAGGFVGMTDDIDASTEYTVILKHSIDSLINQTGDADTLTTSQVYLCGFLTYDQPTYLWSGSVSSRWNTAANWDENAVPVTAGFAVIPDVTNDPVISGDDSINRIGIETGGQLTIENSGSLTIVSDLYVEGNLLIQANADSAGSLIIGRESSGNVTIECYLTADQWHIVSAPVTTQSISSFLTDGGNSIPDKSGSYGVTDYVESTNKYGTYFTTSTPGNFTAGKGYLMRRGTSDGVVTYTGELYYADLPVNITDIFYGWNAVGNPFTSALGATSDATTYENFISVNLAQLDPNYGALYLWDEQPGYTGTQKNYKVIGNSGYTDLTGYTELNQDYLLSGQGFLVKSKSGGGTLTFSTEMQIHRGYETMLKSASPSWDGFKLIVRSGGNETYTILTFHEGMTRGLDPSYDAGLLRGNPDFSIYSRLVDDDQGIDFKIQCLPPLGPSDLVIPIGMDLEAGSDVSFFINGVYMPEEYRIILQDKDENSLTELTPGEGSYDLVVNEAIHGTGRFFLQVLSNHSTFAIQDALSGKKVEAYYQDRRIRIKGPLKPGARAMLYDLNGRKLGTFNLPGTDTNEIPAPSLISGVYLLLVMDGNEPHAIRVPVF